MEGITINNSLIELTNDNFNEYIYDKKDNNVILYASNKCIKCKKYIEVYNSFIQSNLSEFKEYNINYYWYNTAHQNILHNNDQYQLNLLKQSIVFFLKGKKEINYILNIMITYNNIIDNINKLIML